MPSRILSNESAGPGARPEPNQTAAPDRVSRRNLLLFLPLLGFAAGAGGLYAGLRRTGTDLPSQLVGRQVPVFSLSPLSGTEEGFSSADLKGQVSLVNVFASWCVPCRQEHPLFMQLARDQAVPIFGINYKDAPEDASKWLASLGNPYSRVGSDRNGRVSIDWGVYGVPETFVVGADGVIAYRHVGPLNEHSLSATVLPLLNRLRDATGAAA